MKTIFISGIETISLDQFNLYYRPRLLELCKNPEINFNISDDTGCSALVQDLLIKTLPEEQLKRVVVFCLHSPQYVLSEGFHLVGGFNTLEERNAAMTVTSDADYHIILSGRGKSAVENNICRRNSPEYDFSKFLLKGNFEFWSLMFKQEEESVEKGE